MPDMSQVSSWTEALTPFVVEMRISREELSNNPAIRFVRHYHSSIVGDVIYIGDEAATRQAFSSSPPPSNTTFFICGGTPLPTFLSGEGNNFIAVALDELDTYERISSVSALYRKWSDTLDRAVCKGERIQTILDAAAELAAADIVLLNMANRVIFVSRQGETTPALFDELFYTGILSSTLLDALEIQISRESSVVQWRELNEAVCWFYPVFKNGQLISHMLLIAPKSSSSLDGATLLSMLQERITDFFSIFDTDIRYWAGKDFRTLLDDIMAQKMTDEEELERRLTAIMPAPERFCSFVVIEFRKQKSQDALPMQFVTELERFFPNSNIALYPQSIIILLSRPDREFQPFPIFDESGFSALLSQYNAYAAISNATRSRTMLRTFLIMAKSTLQLAGCLSNQISRRVYYFEDYAEYIIIDLCITSCRELFGHDDLIYLTHPDVLALYRYDMKHQDCLLDVLYHYCLNGLSLAKTAKGAYLHRNTVTVKVKKIGELIKADLNNGNIQQRLIFSYKILRYCEKYAKIDLVRRLGSGEAKPGK